LGLQGRAGGGSQGRCLKGGGGKGARSEGEGKWEGTESLSQKYGSKSVESWGSEGKKRGDGVVETTETDYKKKNARNANPL